MAEVKMKTSLIVHTKVQGDNQAATDSAGTGLKDNSDELGLGSRPGRHDDTDRLCGGADRLSHAEWSAAGKFVNGMKP